MCGPPRAGPGHKSFEEAITLNQDFFGQGEGGQNVPQAEELAQAKDRGRTVRTVSGTVNRPVA